MRRLFSLILSGALLVMLAPMSAAAQPTIALGVGGTFPMSDYGDFAKTGFLAHAGVNVPVGDAGVSVGAHGFYGSNSHETDGDKTNLYGGVGSVGYAIATGGSVTPTIFGLVGYLVHSFKSDAIPAADGSEGSLTAGGGVGLGFPLGSVVGVVQAYYLMGFGNNDGTDFVGADVGVQIPVGSNGM